MIWWTSDTHAMHKNVLGFCRRPFANIQEHDDKLIENINKAVKEDDTLIIVGDVSLSPKRKVRAWLKRINCKNLVLVRGNHDNKSSLPQDCFVLIAERLSMKIAGEKVVVSHFSYKWPLWKRIWDRIKRVKPGRHQDRRPTDEGHFLIHGHSHAKEKQVKRMIHVGIDAWNYKPVPHSTLEAMISSTVYREKQSTLSARIRNQWKRAKKQLRRKTPPRHSAK